MKRPVGETPNPAGAEAAAFRAPTETGRPRKGGVLFEAAREVTTVLKLGTLLGVTTLAMTRRGGRGGGTGDYETKDQRGVRKLREMFDAMGDGDKARAEEAAREVLHETVRQLGKQADQQDPRDYQRPQS